MALISRLSYKRNWYRRLNNKDSFIKRDFNWLDKTSYETFLEILFNDGVRVAYKITKKTTELLNNQQVKAAYKTYMRYYKYKELKKVLKYFNLK